MLTAIYFENQGSETTIEELRRGWESLKEVSEVMRGA
jgi:hypothetical protein